MKLKSWDGNAINEGTNYQAVWGADAPHGLPGIGLSRVARSGRWPLGGALERSGRTLHFDVYVRAGTSTALAGWFDPEDETARQLIVEDAAGGNDRYVMAVCTGFDEVPKTAGKKYRVTAQVHGDVRWREVTASTDTWAITATGQTKALTNNGTDDAYPIISLKPTAAKTVGFAYKRWYSVRWNLGVAEPQYPLDIGADGFDTAALINDTTVSNRINQGGGINASVTTIPIDTAVGGGLPSAGMGYVDTEQISWTANSGTSLTGVTRGIGGTTAATHADNAVIARSKMLANGDDLRVYDNGTEIDRWLDGINTSTTKVFVNLAFQPRAEGLLYTGIAASGAITEINLNPGSSGAAPPDMTKFPSSGIVVIDSEAFAYTGKSNADMKLTGVTRAVNGTSEAAHTTSDTVWWAQHDLWIYYGDSTLSAPTVDDDYKPMFALASSTNTSWDYDDFGDSSYTRSGRWSYINGNNSTQYTANRNTNADPWSELGIMTAISGSAYSTGRLEIHNPCGITQAAFANGEKYSASSLAAWYAYIYSATVGTTIVLEDTIAAPSALVTWEAWSDTEVITSGKTIVGLYLQRAAGIPPGLNDQMLECADVTLTIGPNYPTIVQGAEQSNYPLACTLTNNTTGDVLTLTFGMALNQYLELDTDGRTVIYLADNTRQFQALGLTGGARRDWLRLAPGANTIQFDDTGTAGVTIDFEWEERSYQ